MYYVIEKDLKESGIKYITVYTLSAKSDDKYYAQTREFYKKLGFTEIYETTKIWNEENPFLIMVKSL